MTRTLRALPLPACGERVSAARPKRAERSDAKVRGRAEGGALPHRRSLSVDPPHHRLLRRLAASGGLAVYSASFGSFEKTWGTLSAVVVTLVWLWLGGAALLLGAEIDAASRTLRERPSPA